MPSALVLRNLKCRFHSLPISLYWGVAKVNLAQLFPLRSGKSLSAKLTEELSPMQNG